MLQSRRNTFRRAIAYTGSSSLYHRGTYLYSVGTVSCVSGSTLLDADAAQGYETNHVGLSFPTGWTASS